MDRDAIRKLPACLQCEVSQYVHGDKSHWRKQFDAAVDELEAHIGHLQDVIGKRGIFSNGIQTIKTRLIESITDIYGKREHSLRAVAKTPTEISGVYKRRKVTRMRNMGGGAISILYWDDLADLEDQNRHHSAILCSVL